MYWLHMKWTEFWKKREKIRDKTADLECIKPMKYDLFTEYFALDEWITISQLIFFESIKNLAFNTKTNKIKIEQRTQLWDIFIICSVPYTKLHNKI